MYGSETWTMSRDNEARLERNEMKMIRWMAGVKLTDRFRNSCLRERLGLEDIQLVLRKRRLRWFGHVERREGEWVKNCMELEVIGKVGRGRPKRTWREVIEKDMSVVGLRRQDTMDRVKWRQGVKSIR